MSDKLREIVFAVQKGTPNRLSINQALSQIKQYFHPCIKGNHRMVGPATGATHCERCELDVRELYP